MTEADSPADELRVRIHQHLRRYPRLTVHDLARVLRTGNTSVRTALLRMQADGEALAETGPKCEGDHSTVTRWTAT